MRRPPLLDVVATNGRKATAWVPECQCGVETSLDSNTNKNPIMDMQHEQNIKLSYAKEAIGRLGLMVTVV